MKRFLLISNQHAYAGREYASLMAKANIPFDWAEFGDYPPVSETELERCKGLWQPERPEKIHFTGSRRHFKKLDSSEFKEWAKQGRYELAIQGGVGILKPDTLSLFLGGILNLHPGRVPHYRGCSAPEWQLKEQQPIMATAHIIDSGIDTGPVFSEFELNINTESYEAFRASVYPQVALGLVRILKEIEPLTVPVFKNQLTPQNMNDGQYRKYYGDKAIEELKEEFTQVVSYLKTH